MNAPSANPFDLRDASRRNMSPPLVSQSSHRRIALQSSLDFVYLRNSALRTAREKIDLNLPPDVAMSQISSDGNGDVMRRIVEREVADYVNRVFEDVKSNIEINGIAGEELSGLQQGDKAPGEDLEAFDTQLADRISSLHGQIEKLNVELASIRRGAVKKTIDDFEADYKTHVAHLEIQEEGSATIPDEEKTSSETLSWAVGLGARENRINRSWDEALAGLRRLHGKEDDSLLKTKQKAATAQEVVRYLEGV